MPLTTNTQFLLQLSEKNLIKKTYCSLNQLFQELQTIKEELKNKIIGILFKYKQVFF